MSRYPQKEPTNHINHFLSYFSPLCSSNLTNNRCAVRFPILLDIQKQHFQLYKGNICADASDSLTVLGFRESSRSAKGTVRAAIARA